MCISSVLRAAFRRWAALGRFTNLILCIFVPLGATTPVVNWFTREKDKKASTDYGYGPDKLIGIPRPKLVLGQVPPSPKTTSPIGAAAPMGSGAGGFFGPAFPWPIIPLQVALLPDGRVLSYGTDQMGNQGAQMIYDVWDPTVGNSTNAHTVLPNNTTTDLFCSAVSLLASGNALIIGGDRTQDGFRNYSNNKVEIFSPT